MYTDSENVWAGWQSADVVFPQQGRHNRGSSPSRLVLNVWLLCSSPYRHEEELEIQRRYQLRPRRTARLVLTLRKASWFTSRLWIQVPARPIIYTVIVSETFKLLFSAVRNIKPPRVPGTWWRWWEEYFRGQGSSFPPWTPAPDTPEETNARQISSRGTF